MFQVFWINIGMGLGTWLGFRISDYFFWDEEIKYKVWEEIETEYWKVNGLPKNIQPQVEFDSVIHPGTKFLSYLPPFGNYITEDIYEKYSI